MCIRDSHECTLPGGTKGTGFKMRTKVSDVYRIPLQILEKDKAPNFDIKKIFAYITPDIASWDKQDSSLTELEADMYQTYWGCANTQVSGYNGQQGQQETATKVLANMKPKESRLNRTADWAQSTIRMTANLMVSYYYDIPEPNTSITLGRDYILEGPTELLATYFEMKKNGVPDSMLDEQYQKYIKALYQSNPMQESIYLKKFDVEPFPHLSAKDVEASQVILEVDKLAKRYFGEWDDTIDEAAWLSTDVKTLRDQLYKYAAEKQAALEIEEPEELNEVAPMAAPNKKVIKKQAK